jgi:hypothetical protein
MKYRKKPVIIEAVKYNGGNGGAIAQWMKVPVGTICREPDCLHIETLEGTHRADVGDFIICGVQGEFYPCKPDIFEQTYEPVTK